MKKKQSTPSRIVGRKVGREISQDEMIVVSGGCDTDDDDDDDDDPLPDPMGPPYPGDYTHMQMTMVFQPGPNGAVSYDTVDSD